MDGVIYAPVVCPCEHQSYDQHHQKHDDVDENQLDVSIVVALKCILKFLEHTLIPSLTSPSRNNNECKDDTPEVRKVRNVPATVQQEIQSPEYQHQVFRLDRNWGYQQLNLHVRKNHTKTHKQSVDGTRSAHHGTKYAYSRKFRE